MPSKYVKQSAHLDVMADELGDKFLESFREAYLQILTDTTPDGPSYEIEQDLMPARNQLAWCFTINNPKIHHIKKLKEIETKYKNSNKPGSVLYWELEVGWAREWHTNADGTQHLGQKTLHIQGYIERPSKTAKSALEALLDCKFPGKSAQPPNGSHLHNKRYVSKDRRHPEFAHLYEHPWTYGEVCTVPHDAKPIEQGKRNDIDELVIDIQAGMDDQELVKKHPHLYLRYSNGINSLLRLRPKKAREPLQVIWHWGGSGCGKTYDAETLYGPSFTKRHITGYWWDGYEPEETPVVVLDEVDKNDYTSSLGFLLPILEQKSMKVQIKGGMRQFTPTHIILTSTKNPRDIFVKQDAFGEDTPESLLAWEQVVRRVHKIRHYKKKRVIHCIETVYEDVE